MTTANTAENTDSLINATLAGICSDIRECGDGNRNETLNTKAFKAYQIVGAGQLTEQEVTNSLTIEAEFIGLPANEIKDTLRSAKAKGMADPKPVNGSKSDLSPEIKHKAQQQAKTQNDAALKKQTYSLEQLYKMRSNSAADSPYLKRKNLTDPNIINCFFSGEDNKGSFTAHVLFNDSNKECGYERIYHDNRKMISAGCGATGVYFGAFTSGEMDDSVCYITEGAADAISIMLATKSDCYSATSAGNIQKVADLKKADYKKVIVCLDSDEAGLKAADKLKESFEVRLPITPGSDYSDAFVSGGVEEVLIQLKNKPKQPVNLLDFSSFTLNDSVEDMEAQMKDDVFIMGEFALMGQITCIYAAPNTGKTLMCTKLLIDAVNNENIAGEDIFYINADDTYRGLVTKTKMFNKYGINMLAPGHNGFKTEHVIQILSSMTADDQARGKVVVLDTLKKFNDLMNKTTSRPFNEILRQFASKGGTVIQLAHINKHRDAEGKPVYQGTTDNVDDIDCAYFLDCTQEVEGIAPNGNKMTTKIVQFENFKSRGDVVQKESYQYKRIDKAGYENIINSIDLVDEARAALAEKQDRQNALLEQNESAIECVIDGIKCGENSTTVLIERLIEVEGLSKAKARALLGAHEGDNYSDGHRWKVEKGGERNLHIYSELNVWGK